VTISKRRIILEKVKICFGQAMLYEKKDLKGGDLFKAIIK
jgi:hypothetical protein